MARSSLLAAASLFSVAFADTHIPLEVLATGNREARQLKGADFLDLIKASRPPTADPLFDCAWRPLALQYAQQLQPWRAIAEFQAIHDALELSTLCNQTFHASAVSARLVKLQASPSAHTPLAARDIPAGALWVDPTAGSDSNPGTQAQPLQHVAFAVAKARGLAQPATVVLRGGVHRLSSTLELGAADAGLTITSYPGDAEPAVISSGQVLGNLNWQPYNVSTNSSSYFQIASNVDAMWGDWPSPTVFNMSSMASWQDCQTACQSYAAAPGCQTFVWYDPKGNFGPEWDSNCFIRTDSTWAPTAQNFTTSGHRITPPNVWMADLSALNLPAWLTTRDDFILSLLYSPDGGFNVNRATRARYPNANPELDQFPTGWSQAGTYQAGTLNMKTDIVNVNLTGDSNSQTVNYPSDGTATMFTDYWWGNDGPCSRYTPQSSYWCQPNGRVAGSTYFINTPAGLVADSSALPNSPYNSEVVTNGALFNYWRHGHWFTMMARIAGYNASNSTLTLGYGAFQGAEGDGTGEAWYVEHIFEELDAPNEFYYDSTKQQLYYFHNDTNGAPPPNGWTWEIPMLETLISVTGTPDAPASGITIQGVQFTSAAATYLSPHGTPSGGDWGLARNAAVLLGGTQGVTINNCTFIRVDGNAIFISGFNRNTTVTGSSFAWIGDSAIASWGYSDGVDATAGNQPWGNTITGNICRELGLMEKQSSCYFQAQSSGSLVQGNIFYNGPRAHVNFNDGMPGGAGSSRLLGNLIFNSCRESQDHGPFNSWDRVPYIGQAVVSGGEPTLYQDWHEIGHNFMVANYGANGGAVDNDDGSSRYRNHDNFWVYGGHKSDFDGHQKISYNNICAYANVYGSRCVMVQNLPQHGFDPYGVPWSEGFFNNTCILTNAGDEYLSIGSCDPANKTAIYEMITNNNRIYAPNADVVVTCGSKLTFAQWQATGLDVGTTVQETPDAATIIGWAAQLLGISTDI